MSNSINFVLFDDKSWQSLKPLTYTRPVAELRVGILTIKEKWEKYLDAKCSYLTQEHLSAKFPMVGGEVNCLINASVFPNSLLIADILFLQPGEVLTCDGKVIAAMVAKEDLEKFNADNMSGYKNISFTKEFSDINDTWNIFQKNGEQIHFDFDLITKGRKSQPISTTNNILGEENVFVEEGASFEFVTLNASAGPIYIGKDTEIMEGAVVRGPFALCEHATVKMSAKIYGSTTIGPNCKVGGEVSNAVFFGNANKGHDGFLGNAVIGEWCNLGADTNNSNLKNNYGDVQLWSYATEGLVDTGLQFCGLIMGDHAKTGINTMLNTGTVIGVNANIYGHGFPDKFIPSYTWGGINNSTDYNLQKAFDVAEKVMVRRGIELTDDDKNILTHIFDESSKYRG